MELMLAFIHECEIYEAKGSSMFSGPPGPDKSAWSPPISPD